MIHGAGLIKDKLIREKTPESFDRVLGTKVDGALNLIRLVRPEALKFAALFSSIAGPVRQCRSVGLRGGQRGPQQAGAMARPPMVRAAWCR